MQSPETSELEVRASALQLARSKLGVSGAALRASLERERVLLAAAADALEGRSASVRSEVSERAATTSREAAEASVSTTTAASPSTLYGDFAPYDRSAEILNAHEGNFRETIRRGAFSEQIRSGRRVELLYQHGKDPYVGSKPLGKITLLEERSHAAYFEAKLLDATYVRDVAAAASEGLLGASFRFEVIRDRWSVPAQATAENPTRIPERELFSVAVHELGPCMFAAYSQTFIGVRSNDAHAGYGHVRHGITAAQRAFAVRRAEMFRRGITPRRSA